MTKEQLWAKWRLAAHALGQGRVQLALSELDFLHEQRSILEPELLNDVTFTRGVALVINGQSNQATELFQELRETKGFGSKFYCPVSTLMELSGALSQQRQFDKALEIAEEAVVLAGDDAVFSALPYFHRAIARQGLGQKKEALADFRKSLRGEIAGHQIVRAGVCAEWLARLSINTMNAQEGLAWAERMRSIYNAHSPQHLRTAGDVIRFMEDDVFTSLLGGGDLLLGEDGVALDALIASMSPARRNHGLTLLDIDLLAFLNGVVRSQGEHLHVLLPIDKGDARFEGLAELIKSDIETISAHSLYPGVIKSTWLFNHLGMEFYDLPLAPQMLSFLIRLQTLEADTRLLWESAGAWPWAFATTLLSLSNLYRIGFIHGVNKLEERQHLGAFETTDYFSKTLPWATQGRYLSLGQVSSKLVKIPPHFFEDLVRESVFNPTINCWRFERMGYSTQEAKDLNDGGMLALPVSDVHGAPTTFGGHPLNEFNAANPPATMAPWQEKNNLRWGFFVDRNYQTPFIALRPDDYALHGQSNELFHDHFEPFRDGLKVVGSARAKHYSVPIIEASDAEELEAIAAKLKANPRVKDEIFFRGQTGAHTLPRTEPVKRILFGRSDVVEPSLLGAAPRRGLDYNHVHSPLQLVVQDFMYRQAVSTGRQLEQVHQEWQEYISSGPGKWEIGVMALAQHYGIPTHGLDITSSLDVASWFATHKYFKNGATGLVRYVRMSEDQWPADPERWPVVYLVQPVTHSIRPSIRSIESLENLGIAALRPARQCAYFFMGADTLHQNRLAESLACVVRLKPGNWTSTLDYEHLFPKSKDDPAYEFMLEIKRQEKKGPLGDFFNEIAEYEY